ncbi:hypothetical protein, partial [Xanthomonas sp. LMG 8989]|uniref:hypothetical protein n=1 Tax=Xanthomonas sp. LMG 8989 TaxID=1591156 RepID=UPI001F3CF6C3
MVTPETTKTLCTLASGAGQVQPNGHPALGPFVYTHQELPSNTGVEHLGVGRFINKKKYKFLADEISHDL